LALDTGPEARQLYNVYEKIMRAVYELNIEENLEGLQELRQGVEGRGDDIGRLIEQGADLFESIRPAIDNEVLPNLRRVTTNFDAALPDIVDTLNNSSELADMLLERQDGLRELLVAGAGVTGNLDSLLGAVANDTIVVIRGVEVTARSLSSNEGVDNFMDSVGAIGGFGSAFASGRLNIQAVATLEQPLPYTSADCPQYPGLSSPTCGMGGPSTAPTPVPLNELLSVLAGAPIAQGQGEDPLAVLEREIMRRPATPASAESGRPSIATTMLLGPLVRGTVVEVE
jgi:phospholipid/cholesterol/gamma-HCH transport system substrate-binding protein